MLSEKLDCLWESSRRLGEYPPSVISLIPELIERTGVGVNGVGSITSIYTILADGDDTVSDPIVDNAPRHSGWSHCIIT